MLKGWLPYKNIAIAHNPLMLVDLLILFKLVGVGITQLKVFTWLLILLSDIVLFFVAKKLWDKRVAILSLAFFIPLQIIYEGNGLWFDLYMGLLAFICFYTLKTKQFVWAGIFWAAALLTKQTAVYFLVPIAFYFFGAKKTDGVKKFLTGALGVGAVFSATLFIFNLWPDYINWAIKFGVFTLPKAAGQIHYPTLKQLAVSLFAFAVFIPYIIKKPKSSVELSAWAFVGLLGAYPRFELFHFQPALFYLAIVGAIVFSQVKKKEMLLKVFLALFLVVFGTLFVRFGQRDWKAGTRFFDTTTQKVTASLSEASLQGEKVFVANYWDSVYALSGTLPAVDPWVPQLSWYINQPGIEEEMVKGLERTKPNYIVLGEYTDGGLSSFKPELINEFIEENYEVVDKIDGVYILQRELGK
jgi:hypothetical protein